MSFLSKAIGLFSGSGGNFIDTISDTVDRFVTTPDEKRQIKAELVKMQEDQLQNERNFHLQMEQLIQDRESEIESTIRSELDAKKDILIAELNQGDNYTKRARPTVIYTGLVFIFLEILGLRHIILNAIGVGPEVITSSDEVFKTFLMAWAGVVSAYSIGRSVEKRGSRKSWVSKITGNTVPSTSTEEIITKSLKDKIKW